VIPSAIVAGFLLALWLRWWAVAVVAVGWAALIFVNYPSSALSAAAFGAVNGAVGAAVAVAVRRVLDMCVGPDSE
jgi:hypothetical protein